VPCIKFNLKKFKVSLRHDFDSDIHNDIVGCPGSYGYQIYTIFLFPETKEPPKMITYLGRVLPPAMMGLLVVYCLKGVSIRTEPHGIPELIAILVIFVIHRWKNNVLISIGSGTIVYMILVQRVFC
jgi:branched-subunit amino acid transport protein AzlD